MTHNEKLEAINDLCTVRENLENSLVGNSVSKSLRESQRIEMQEDVNEDNQ